MLTIKIMKCIGVSMKFDFSIYDLHGRRMPPPSFFFSRKKKNPLTKVLRQAGFGEYRFTQSAPRSNLQTKFKEFAPLSYFGIPKAGRRPTTIRASLKATMPTLHYHSRRSKIGKSNNEERNIKIRRPILCDARTRLNQITPRLSETHRQNTNRFFLHTQPQRKFATFEQRTDSIRA